MYNELHFDPYEDPERVNAILQEKYGTIPIKRFLNLLKRHKIPPRAPHGCTPRGLDFLPFDMTIEGYHVKDKLRRLGMFAIVDKYWTKQLANWIDGRRCLEIMSGWGWLAKALSEHGVNIVATDDYSWGHYEMIQQVHPIEQLDACEAVEKYNDAEVLLCSWPYMDNDFTAACRLWGSNRPIIYIGEGYGGCTANDEFYEGFQELNEPVKIDLLSWNHIHDRVQIGHWKETDKK